MILDLLIEKELSSRILSDSFIASKSIKVTVRRGVAVLSGIVDCYTKKIAAENIVLKNENVIHVENKIRLVTEAALQI